MRHCCKKIDRFENEKSIHFKCNSNTKFPWPRTHFKKNTKKKSDAVSLAKKNKTKNRQRRRVGGRSHFTGPNPKNCLNYSWSHFQVSAHTHTHTHTHTEARVGVFCWRLVCVTTRRISRGDTPPASLRGRLIEKKNKQTKTTLATTERKAMAEIVVVVVVVVDVSLPLVAFVVTDTDSQWKRRKKRLTAALDWILHPFYSKPTNLIQ